MSQTSTSIFDKARTLRTIKARKNINDSHVGALVRAQLTSDGNIAPVMDKDDKTKIKLVDGKPLNKVIYNVALNSVVAMGIPANIEILQKAVAAEKAGNAEEASELYKQYLNKIQVSFSTWENAPRFGRGQHVQGIVEKVTTDNGSLLRLDKVQEVRAEFGASVTAESMEDFLGQFTGTSEQPADKKADDEALRLLGSK